ncbi:MAG TPA: ribulose-phosphate 3-epimerase [Planctomycetota bacterium]|jgi:ribulose-phosphate 3-epimerase
MPTSKSVLIAPSILSADFTKLKDEVQAIEAAGADWIHVDVADGDFVPNITMGPFIVEALKRISKLPLDCHLMIQHPERFVEPFAKAGAAAILVHPEAKGDIHGALDHIRALNVRPGMAINPETPPQATLPFKGKFEQLLMMTVHPGFSGKKMMLECLPKFGIARQLLGPNVLLEVDGGATVDNAPQVRAAGADVIVAATAIFKSGDYAAAVRALRG